MVEELIYYFVDEEHEGNFKELCAAMKSMKGNREYRAAGYILALPELYPKARQYFSDAGFRWFDLLKKVDLSSGHRIMVNLAVDLFGGATDRPLFNVGDAIAVLDTKMYRAALAAIQIRRPVFGVSPTRSEGLNRSGRYVSM
ncbi:hypothetical protein MTHERMOG20_23680 [Moorella thermoacetica]|uniref:Uncharacterized protein n=1 Tax=Moorella thermoacetica (strain ATCC 39073 / JCM 9320) TaxID=264732 RepID=Q2RLJ6_MOOTA|nr:hypothetical protein [Moorella thermoacetica]AKX95752.1 hypothetical protein MOTHA_c03830 [Moorella thermoacetica]OIQ11589.1 hypothetical protein MOOTH_15750 [Moorella thermoacetica]OIQ54587.1 hypothetical protein MOCA_22560 [Moorella thermoacetica]QCZ99562.1 hypothetical protein MothHH_00392 [Moorella thermoacetica]TYL07222.1 hypothetical protein MOOCA_23300 [Moorella thermoacetica]